MACSQKHSKDDFSLMPDTNPGRGRTRSAGPTTPEAFPTTTPQLPSGDYSYTVELVARIENQLGRLAEAIDSLKTQTKEHSAELRAIGKDVHAAKMVAIVRFSSFWIWAQKF
jgi:hypothetical protein